MVKIKEIKFDQCNGLKTTVESESGSPPKIIQGMAIEINYQDLEVYVKITSILTEETEYVGEIYKIDATESSNIDFAVKDMISFTRDQICSILPTTDKI
jgi:hypothetical protein